MAETLGAKLDRIQAAIEAIESGRAESYEIEGRKMSYLSLPSLYNREASLLSKIEKYGRDYIEGQNSGPAARRARVVFS